MSEKITVKMTELIDLYRRIESQQHNREDYLKALKTAESIIIEYPQMDDFGFCFIYAILLSGAGEREKAAFFIEKATDQGVDHNAYISAATYYYQKMILTENPRQSYEIGLKWLSIALAEGQKIKEEGEYEYLWATWGLIETLQPVMEKYYKAIELIKSEQFEEAVIILDAISEEIQPPFAYALVRFAAFYLGAVPYLSKPKALECITKAEQAINRSLLLDPNYEKAQELHKALKELRSQVESFTEQPPSKSGCLGLILVLLPLGYFFIN